MTREPRTGPGVGSELAGRKAEAVRGTEPTQGFRRGGDDVLRTTARDSRRMGGVRQRDTRAELAVRRALTALGVRYRINVKSLPGRPDVANASRRLAIFVHGCFWHRHTGCRRSTTPTRNREFWLEKFAANVKRDRRAVTALRAAGYQVIVVWECETENETALLAGLRERIRSTSESQGAA